MSSEFPKQKEKIFVDIFKSRPFTNLGKFFDAIIRTDDGAVFRIHRVLLAFISPYFRALFCGDFDDGVDVTLRGIDGRTMEVILGYIYTKTIRFDQENVMDILVAADFLLIDDLVQKCKSFVLSKMGTGNCILILLVAWRVERVGMYRDCHRFVIVHFEEASRRASTRTWNYLPVEVVGLLLADRRLNVISERVVWEVMKKWLEFDPCRRLKHIPDLLKCIRFGRAEQCLLDDIYLTMERFDYLSQSTIGCGSFNELQRLASQNPEQLEEPRTPPALHLLAQYQVHRGSFDIDLFLTYDDHLDFWRKLTQIPFCPDFLVQISESLFMFNTWENSTLVYNLADDTFSSLPPSLVDRMRYLVTCVGDQIYILGGVTSTFQDTDIVERYDTRTNTWHIVNPMLPLILSEVVVMNGFMYVIGDTRNPAGRNNSNRFNALQNLPLEFAPDPDMIPEWDWIPEEPAFVLPFEEDDIEPPADHVNDFFRFVPHRVPELPGGRVQLLERNGAPMLPDDQALMLPDDPALMPPEERVPILRGHRVIVPSEGRSMMVQVFNPESNDWTTIVPPTIFRHDFAAVAYRGRLYVIGGRSYDRLLVSVEEYDPVQESWSTLPDLPVSYSNPKAVVLRGQLIVYDNPVENRHFGNSTAPVLWNVATREWKIIHCLSPLFDIHLYLFCTVKDPETVEILTAENRRLEGRWSKSPFE